MLPITMASAGESILVKKITGKDDTRHHLNELLILQVKDGRIALDEKLATRIRY